jgi:hypothetical protein
MNLVMSQVEESIHIVDVTEDGQALPTRVRMAWARLESRRAQVLTPAGGKKRGGDAVCSG